MLNVIVGVNSIPVPPTFSCDYLVLAGGGGGSPTSSVGSAGGNGGSGTVILKYPDTRTITIGAGLTGTTGTPSGGFIVSTITAGTGNVSWS